MYAVQAVRTQSWDATNAGEIKARNRIRFLCVADGVML
jgi:hypothetical protein